MAVTDAPARRTGVLLVNLGTPDAPTPGAVQRYLREFLSDPRVLDVPAPLRWALLNLVILPFRPRRSAAQYRSVWMPEGSPLLVHGQALRDAVAKALGDGFVVELAMRYGRPDLASALARLVAADVAKIVVLPLYPQYAASSGGSTAERVLALAAARWNVPPLELIGDFHDDPGFVEAFAEVARPVLADFRPDFVLLSYHGLPERHVRKSDASGAHCLASPRCCDAVGPVNRYCYRAQCYGTSRLLAAALGLAPDRVSTSFQSRLGRDPWIQPYTDEVLPELAARGVKRLAVLCPAFVADCLETVEEIGVRAAEQWRGLGGEALQLVPSLNASPRWVRAVAELVRGRR
jgi:ferrochelatase